MYEKISKKHLDRIILEYKKEDAFEVYGYGKFIQKHVVKGNKIPARVLLKFFSFFKNPVLAEKELLKKMKPDIISLINDRFLELYDFKYKKLVDKGTAFEVEVKSNFSDMINYVLDAIIDEDNQYESKWKKEQYIDYLFKIFSRYRSKKYIPKKILTDYKMGAISAFITWKMFGFKVAYKKDPTNDDLFQSSRHARKS